MAESSFSRFIRRSSKAARDGPIEDLRNLRKIRKTDKAYLTRRQGKLSDFYRERERFVERFRAEQNRQKAVDAERAPGTRRQARLHRLQ